MSSSLPFTRNDLTILVIDDDIIQLKAVSKILVDSGFKVITAENGESAYKILKSGEKIDLVLSDVMMPVMNGPEFLTKAREDKLLQELPIVMMSSNDQYEIVFDCLSKGADDYILKPMTKQVLSNIFANVYTKRRQNEAVKKVEQQQIEKTVLEQKINDMKKKFSEAIKTPLNEVITSLESLLSKNILNTEASKEIQKIINNSRLYNSKVEDNDNGKSLSVSRPSAEFFRSQFGQSDIRRTPKPVRVLPTNKIKSPAAQVPLYKSLNLPEQQLLNLEFDIWNLKDVNILNFCFDIFNFHNIKQKIGCKDGELELFIKRIGENYRPNPFNNIRRSVGGLHFVSAILKQMPDIFTDVEIVAVLFAAFALDLDHPGTNNAYQIGTVSKRSMYHNNKSVNESVSASLGNMIIDEIFSNSVDSTKLFEIRKLFISLILKTDYAKIHKLLEKVRLNIKTLCIESDDSKKEDFELDWNKPETRKRALQILILMGDNSFAIKNWDSTRFWYRVMRDEQMSQGDIMRKSGIEVNKYMDRTAQCPDCELFLLHFNMFVEPTFKVGSIFFKSINMDVMKNIELNMQKLKSMDDVKADDN